MIIFHACARAILFAGAVVADPRDGRGQPAVGHVAQPAAGRREREPGRAEPRVLHGHGVHHAAHVGVGEPDRAVHGVHEPAAAVVAGHHGVGGRGDHAAAAAGDHRGRRVGGRRHGHDRGLHGAPLRQRRQRVRRQLQRQRVEHGRPEDAGLQQAQAGRGVRVDERDGRGVGGTYIVIYKCNINVDRSGGILRNGTNATKDFA